MTASETKAPIVLDANVVAKTRWRNKEEEGKSWPQVQWKSEDEKSKKITFFSYISALTLSSSFRYQFVDFLKMAK